MKPFKFKHFTIQQENSALKVGTDAMLLGSIVTAQNPQYCLDIGTGTGVIALMLAQKFESAKIVALEPDESSLIDCKVNFSNSNWNERLTVVGTSIQAFKTELKFDLIATNPPFYEAALLSDNQVNNLAKHATIGLLEDFFIRAKSLLSENGLFWIILPIENEVKWIDFASTIGLNLQTEFLIESKPNSVKRCILAFSLNRTDELTKQTLLVRNADNSYSEEYKALTKEFHFNKL